MLITDTVKSLIQLALAEDIGRGDWTTNLIVPIESQARADVWIKQSARVAGLPILEAVFHMVDPSVQIRTHLPDGSDIADRAIVCDVAGPTRSILSAERTALNFLARLSGIATMTRNTVALLEGTRTQLLDTRKTTPGWRVLEKYAVRIGGGHNHRFGLDDMILIKDNHIVAAGGVEQALKRAREGAPAALRIEVEVDSLQQLEAALAAGADFVLLDNMDVALLTEAVSIAKGRAKLEASGNVTVGRIREIANTGVDYISMGALTHSAVSVDVGLDIELV